MDKNKEILAALRVLMGDYLKANTDLNADVLGKFTEIIDALVLQIKNG